MPEPLGLPPDLADLKARLEHLGLPVTVEEDDRVWRIRFPRISKISEAKPWPPLQSI